MPPLPYLTAALPGIAGVLRATLDDFTVEELPAYEPSGDGEHVYVRFEKRDMTTPYALGLMARALGADPRDVGYAGLKDRHAVTVQCATFPRVDPARVEALALDGIRVLAVARHRNKIRTGHLVGNRFRLRVTGVGDVAEAVARCEAVAAVLRARGAPNYYGDQRFGREGDNADHGLAWLRGQRPAPRDHFLRKLWVSAAQSELFNRYLARRVDDGDLDRYVPGDLAVRHSEGRLGGGRPFVIEPETAQELYVTRAASATGPMYGTRMQPAEGPAGLREAEVLAAAGLTVADFARARDLAEGTRRPVRVLLDDLAVQPDGAAVALAFTLPPGGYATAILREFQKSAGDGLKPDGPDGIQPGGSARRPPEADAEDPGEPPGELGGECTSVDSR